jgi:zinc transport system substrate-binding protein
MDRDMESTALTVMMRRRGWFYLFVGALVNLSSVEAAEGKLRVLTSFMPMYCFAANVAGDLAMVDNLLPANVGPHDYHPVQSDYEKLRRADLFVVNGLKLEEWLDPMVRSRRGKNPLVQVEAAEGLGKQLIREVPHLHLEDAGVEEHSHASDANPHIWLDPMFAAHAVTNILRAFQKADPPNAEGYARNAAAYIVRIQALHQDYRDALGKARGISIVTYHDAFVYLARRYELKIAGVIEVTPEVTPSLRYQGSLRKAVRSNKVRVIFAEPQFPKRIAEQLSADTGVPLDFLDTLETAAAGPLRLDSYEQSMRANLNVLIRHLQ